MEAFNLTIKGDVQGVSYRYFAKNEAKKLGLTGWTKNEHDGTVSVFIQGDPEKVQTFVDWAKEGSPMATVEEVSIKTTDPNEKIKIFEVR